MSMSMSIPTWSNKSNEKFKGLVTESTPIAIPMGTDSTLFLANIGNPEITVSGKEKQEVVRDNKSYAKSQFALCALKNTYARKKRTPILSWHRLQDVVIFIFKKSIFKGCNGVSKSCRRIDCCEKWSKDENRPCKR